MSGHSIRGAAVVARCASLAGGLALLCACQVSPQTQTDASGLIPVSSGTSARQELPARTLEPGACGLFLWTRRENPKFVFFKPSALPEAELWHDGKMQTLVQTSTGGRVFGQEFTEQSFTTAGKTMPVSLTLLPGETLVGGQRVPEGNIRITSPDGWELIVPVAGVFVCQPD